MDQPNKEEGAPLRHSKRCSSGPSKLWTLLPKWCRLGQCQPT